MNQEKRYPLEWNEADPSVHLMPEADYYQAESYVASLKKDLEDWKHSRYVWGKYKDDFWFQRALPSLTPEYMQEQFLKYFNLIDFFEPELDAWERITYLHRAATEHLSKSMTYLKQIDLTKVSLTQKPLF